ncbi:MAG: protein translocase SEC61 complex subunit gamma [Nitrososphaeria archaeon]|nr:protein translocase SEC61 complex subunit gamma [Nitrososphaeria archaeon]NIN53266.1 protein translocase SEC61 complex subunit gamma [Nitrososphaeria archaeon]NIQ33717.1 protein translocase SEC61 complex subunit gamma [Nitrososphaeria archaeon]
MVSGEIIKRHIRVLKLAKKPTFSEFWLYAKLTILGVGLLGIISFVIKLFMSFLFLGG